MLPRVRLIHKTLLDGRFHVLTSPDVKGLHVAMETLAGAQREAITILDDLAREAGDPAPVVDFAARTVEAA